MRCYTRCHARCWRFTHEAGGKGEKSGASETSETDDGSRSEIRGFRNVEPRTSNFGSRLSRLSVSLVLSSYASTRHSTIEPCLPASVARCDSGRIRVEAFVSRMETGPGPHICFFHAGKPMLDQQEILDMASPKSSGMSIAVHRPVQHTP